MSSDLTEEQDEQQEVTEEEELDPLQLPSVEAPLIEIKDIPTEQIAELDNIRPTYDGIEKLAETMHLNGQLQPCWVRPALDQEHGKQYELIFGYRRKRAAEYLQEQEVDGWETLRCEVRDVKSNEQISQMIVENFQREALDPVAEARAMRALKHSQEPPLTNTEVANQLGCDPSHVSHRLGLLNLALPAVGDTHVDTVEAEEVDPETLQPQDAKEGDDDAPEHEQEVEEEIEDTKQEAEEKEKPKKKEKVIDILGMVENGEISASTAEVIASLPERHQQEKLAVLAKKHGWSTKKAASWARDAKEHEVDESSADLGPVEMIQMEDVVELPRLLPKDDLSDEQIKKITLYALLRNGLDREMLDYLAEEMGYPYERLWDYVRTLSEEQTDELSQRMALRYISAAHRYHSLESSLRDDLGQEEGAATNPYADPLQLPAPEGESENDLW